MTKCESQASFFDFANDGTPAIIVFNPAFDVSET